MQIEPESTGPPIAYAYVGSVVPDTPEFRTSAFSRAGNLFQHNLLVSMKHAGTMPDLVLSYKPMPSFPRSKAIWSVGRRVELSDGISLTLLPFLNITPLKQLVISFAALVCLVIWAVKKRGRQRVIHCFNLTVPNGWFIWLAGRLTGSRIVANLNDINVPGETVPSTPMARFDYRLQRSLIPRLDGHVAVAAKIMEHFAPQKPYVRIEGGITSDALGCALRERLPGSLSRDFNIVFAGSLTRTNGILLLLEAMKLLPTEGVKVHVAGKGPEIQAVLDAASTDPRIVYCGFLLFDEVLKLYATADLLTNIRLTKSMNTLYFFPSKLMEYLASGVPVLSTATGHVVDEFGELCYLLEDETPQALAEMIQRIAKTTVSERAAMARKAMKYMESEMTWERQGVKLNRYIHQSVLGRTVA